MTRYSPNPDLMDEMRNGRIRVILCEGTCGGSVQPEDAVKLRAAGWRDDMIRAELTNRLRYTRHQYVGLQLERDEHMRRHFNVIYRCVECGSERTYGQEEFTPATAQESRVGESAAGMSDTARMSGASAHAGTAASPGDSSADGPVHSPR